VSEAGTQIGIARLRAATVAPVVPGKPMVPPVDEAGVIAALADVPDPELPVISIVDLGIVERVEVTDGAILVELLPTFVGCPALEAIAAAVKERLAGFGRPVEVRFGYAVPWTTERITGRGRRHLAKSGIAPPGDDTCPYCGSRDVLTDNLFGPTQCRSTRYCRSCRQPHEAFKPV
jgi:ring-1,2-phenylacetyl-CoA epoxidase subunit PaaD